MIRLNRNFLLFVALLCGLFVFAGCGGSKSAATTSTSTATPASTGDKIGVAECDEYIEKVEACLNGKIPEAQRGAFKSSFETARKQWKETAANPQAKAGLATACKQALETAKQAYSSFGCAW
jgi:uncharacterized membrane protein